MTIPPERERLGALVGTWRVTMSVQSADGSVEQAEGLRATKRWIGGKHYVQEEIAGQFAGSPHEKLTLLGYNEARARYEYVTADNYDAVLLLFAGRLGDTAATIEMTAEYVRVPRTTEEGSFVLIRAELILLSPDEHQLLLSYREPGRPERPFLSYVYQRSV